MPSIDDLVAYFRGGAKPRAAFRVGGVDDVRALLRALLGGAARGGA